MFLSFSEYSLIEYAFLVVWRNRDGTIIVFVVKLLEDFLQFLELHMKMLVQGIAHVLIMLWYQIGEAGLWSNHIIYAPHRYRVHISMLLTGLIVHGFNPRDLLMGTLLPLPKDTWGNLCDSDNYRAIILCSCINKILDWCIMIRYGDLLSTSGLQFSYKRKHSSTMCSLTLKEVVNYYRKRHSNIYAVVIDASKDFDRMKYDQLFRLKKGSQQ